MTVIHDILPDMTPVSVDSPVSTGYQACFKLELSIDPGADAVVFDPAQTTLSAELMENELVITDSSSPVSIISQYCSDDETIVVMLSRTVKLASILLTLSASPFVLPLKQAIPVSDSGNKSSEGNKKAGMQGKGDKKAGSVSMQQDKQTKSKEDNQTISIQLVANATLSSPYLLELYRLDGDTVVDAPTMTIPGGVNYSGDGFVADRFAVRVKEGGEYRSLEDERIQEIKTMFFPVIPRIGIARCTCDAHTETDMSTSTDFFWASPQSVSAEVEVSAGRELSACLQRYVDGLDVWPDPFHLVLVVESDAPCNVKLSEVKPVYRLLKKSLIEFQGEFREKQIIRFDGTSLLTRNLSFQIPDASIGRVEIKANKSFKQGMDVVCGDAILSHAEGNELALHVSEKYWMSQQCELSDSALVSGLALSLSGIRKSSSVIVQFREDYENTPLGKVLYEDSVTPAPDFRRTWHMMSFKQALQLASGKYWVSLKASNGDVLWGGRQLEGDESVSLFQMQERDGILKMVNAIKEMRGLLALFASLPVSDNVLPFSLLVNDAEVQPALHRNDTMSYYPVIPSGLSGKVNLSLSSMSAGTLTMYPVSIEYAVQTDSA